MLVGSVSYCVDRGLGQGRRPSWGVGIKQYKKTLQFCIYQKQGLFQERNGRTKSSRAKMP